MSAGITLAQAQEQLDAFLNINKSLQDGQETRYKDRWYKQSDADQVLKQVEYWDKKVKELAAIANIGGAGAGRRCVSVTPRF